MRNQLNQKQDGVIATIESGRNIFVTGAAGTGKSFLLNVCINYFKEQKKKIAIVAPTGTAAIKVRGQTIHSFFKWKPTTNLHNLEIEEKRNPLRLDILFIDEASMVRADHFDLIDKTLRVLTENRDEAFGGVQIVLFGDPYQLPPVVQKGADAEYITANYASPFFFSSTAYKAGEFEVINLDEIYRQTDPTFVEILNCIRIGENVEESLVQLNSLVAIDRDESTIVLCTTNANAEYINKRAIKKIAGDSRIFYAKQSGQNVAAPAPEVLELKIGSNVMFCRNDPERRWVNGTIGKVVGFNPMPIVEVRNMQLQIETVQWDAIRQHYNPETNKIEQDVVGCFEQYPLIAADAITIHKSQGATLEKCVIDLGYGIFADGQLYTALSRCKSLEGLTLLKPVTKKDVRVNPQVRQFMESASC